MGLSYKANCNDIRNSKSITILRKLINKKFRVDVYDPYYKTFNIEFQNKFNFIKKLPKDKIYSAIIISVDHELFKQLKANKLRSICKNQYNIFDIKNIFPKENFFRI